MLTDTSSWCSMRPLAVADAFAALEVVGSQLLEAIEGAVVGRTVPSAAATTSKKSPRS